MMYNNYIYTKIRRRKNETKTVCIINGGMYGVYAHTLHYADGIGGR